MTHLASAELKENPQKRVKLEKQKPSIKNQKLEKENVKPQKKKKTRE